MSSDVDLMRCLADMAQATAWLNFTTAQANHDLQRIGEWQCDYATQAAMFQEDYDRAGRELLRLMANQTGTETTAVATAPKL